MRLCIFGTEQSIVYVYSVVGFVSIDSTVMKLHVRVRAAFLSQTLPQGSPSPISPTPAPPFDVAASLCDEEDPRRRNTNIPPPGPQQRHRALPVSRRHRPRRAGRTTTPWTTDQRKSPSPCTSYNATCLRGRRFCRRFCRRVCCLDNRRICLFFRARQRALGTPVVNESASERGGATSGGATKSE
jgi:hypothetical protein